MRSEAALIALALLCGCSGAPEPQGGGRAPRIIGLTQADGATFTVSPSGAALSILYDDLRVSGEGGAKRPKLEQRRRFAIVASAAALASFDITGARLGDEAGLGELSLVANRRTARVRLGTVEGFRWRVVAPIAAATPVTLTVRFASPQPGPAEIHVDAVDIAVLR